MSEAGDRLVLPHLCRVSWAVILLVFCPSSGRYATVRHLRGTRIVTVPGEAKDAQCTVTLSIAGTLCVTKHEKYRIVTRGVDGQLRIKDYASKESLMRLHVQIGIDDCSTNLSLRGLPIFRGLIGPMSDGKSIVRYESPDVFESLTKEWTADAPHRRGRRRSRSKV
jgi:hypothetical protein